MVKIRLGILAVVGVAVIAIGGCGSSSSGSSGGSGSSSELAGFAPPGSVVFVEGVVQPSGELASNADAIAQTVAGVDLDEAIVSKLESSARGEGQPVDFNREVKPWLGKKAAVDFEDLENGDLSDPIVVVQSTDAGATQEFIDSRTAASKAPFRKASYEGVEFKVGGSKDDAIGVVGNFLVAAGDEAAFKAAVDASQGDSLTGEDRFESIVSAASADSLANVYVDVGALIDQSEGEIGSQAGEVLESSGLDSSDLTALASVVPGSNRVEIEISSDLNGASVPTGDASDLLGSLPADSLAAAATSGFTEQLEEAIDELDASGHPPYLKPNEFKSTLSQAGIDADKIAASIEDAAFFAEGTGKEDLGGALVLTDDSGEATDAVSSLGKLLRGAGVAGVTAVSGKTSGFSIRSTSLRRSPIVVVAKDKRIAIGSSLAEALKGLSTDPGATLGGSPTYKAAVSSLGRTPISAFVDGPAALRLVESMVPRSEADFQEAKPYLRKIRYVAVGAGESQDELATAKVILGLK